jgi:hypothetical protein
MWLIVIGDQREEISPTVAYNSYRQRYDIEHMLRFGKQRLLMTEFQTPEITRTLLFVQSPTPLLRRI